MSWSSSKLEQDKRREKGILAKKVFTQNVPNQLSSPGETVVLFSLIYPLITLKRGSFGIPTFPRPSATAPAQPRVCDGAHSKEEGAQVRHVVWECRGASHILWLSLDRHVAC